MIMSHIRLKARSNDFLKAELTLQCEDDTLKDGHIPSLSNHSPSLPAFDFIDPPADGDVIRH